MNKLFNHVHVRVRDVNRSRAFYASVAEVLGHPVDNHDDKSFVIEELKVTEADDLISSTHLAFKAKNPIAVQLFYDAAIQNGGQTVTRPGVRNYQSGLYSTSVLDPDGNRIDAIFEGQKWPKISVSNQIFKSWTLDL